MTWMRTWQHSLLGEFSVGQIFLVQPQISYKKLDLQRTTTQGFFFFSPIVNAINDVVD